MEEEQKGGETATTILAGLPGPQTKLGGSWRGGRPEKWQACFQSRAEEIGQAVQCWPCQLEDPNSVSGFHIKGDSEIDGSLACVTSSVP